MKIKRVLALLLSVLLLMGCMSVMAAADEQPAANVVVSVLSPESGEVQPGDEVTFAINLVNANNVKYGVFNYLCYINIGEGLEYVSSAASNDTGFDSIFINDKGNGTLYSSAKGSTAGCAASVAQIGTVTCKVAEDATGTLTVTVSGVSLTEKVEAEREDGSIAINRVSVPGAGGSASVIIPEVHTCDMENLNHVEAKASTCTEKGWIEYWQCTDGDCLQYWIKNEGGDWVKAEWSDIELPLDENNHNPGTAWDSDADGHWHTCSDCGAKVDAAEHTAGADAQWGYDETGHWHTCSVCGEKFDAADHEFDWVIDQEATTTSTGLKHEECECGFKRNENTVIDKLPDEDKDDVPKTGDITMQVVMGGTAVVFAMLAMLTAVAFVLKRRTAR